MDEIQQILNNTIESGGAKLGALRKPLGNGLLSYNKTLRLLLDIGSQIEALKEAGYGIMHVTRDNIVEVTDGYMLNIDMSFLSCDATGNIAITDSITFIEGMAPELDSDIKTISYTVAYFSLSSLAHKVLGISNAPIKLYPSKMFFLLERCANVDPEKRIFLLV